MRQRFDVSRYSGGFSDLRARSGLRQDCQNNTDGDHGTADDLQRRGEFGKDEEGRNCTQDTDDLARPDGAKWVCSPPMRTPADQQRLWGGLQEGTLQVIGTDHCGFFYDGTKAIEYEGQPVRIPGKELGAADFSKIPNGLPMVGDRLPIL